MNNENKTDLAMLSKVREQCITVGMDAETFTREASFAVQHFRKNQYLDSATTESKLRSVYNVALTGLTLNPVSKEAFLVPRFAGGVVEACLEPSYIGLLKLVTDTGSVNSIQCNIVWSGDLFEPDLGSNTIKHLPYYTQGKSKGDIFGCYVISNLATGEKIFEFMHVDEIREIMERSESYKAFKSGKAKSCIWVSDFAEMCRKTVIRRAVKYLPRTDKFERLNQAVALDEEDYKMTTGQAQMIEGLLHTATVGEEYKTLIEREYLSYSRDEASKAISFLKGEIIAYPFQSKYNPN